MSDAPAAPRARLVGFVYLAYFVVALPAALRTPLIVLSDPAATADRILGSESLYRLTLACDLIGDGIYLTLTYLLYRLMRPVSLDWARVALLFSVTGCIVQIVSTAALLAPLVLLHPDGSGALGLPAREELAVIAITMFGQGYAVGLLFFGAFDLVLGLLLAVSRFVPRVLAWLMMLAGAGWITFSIAGVLDAAAGAAVQRVVLPIGGAAEVLLALWLVLRGVRAADPSASGGRDGVSHASTVGSDGQGETLEPPPRPVSAEREQRPPG